MIEQAQAEQASQQYRDCVELENNKAFERIVLAEIELLRRTSEEQGRNLSLTPIERDPHHHMSHMLEKLITLVDRRKEEARFVLDEWKREHDEAPIIDGYKRG